MSWGTVTVGRLVLRETFGLQTEVDGTTGQRSINLTGEESSPPLTLAAMRARQEDIAGLKGAFLPVVFTDKTDHNGYYVVSDVSTDLANWHNGKGKFGWTMRLVLQGTDNNIDIESRLTGVKRLNDFTNNGERWHAPSIGHFGYYTGATLPSSMTRTGQDGAIRVFRSVPASVNPRWGCNVSAYMTGRAKVLVDSIERSGTNVTVSPSGWELNNGLVKVTPRDGQTAYLRVSSWNAGGGAWDDKNWRLFVNVTEVITSFDTATVLRNDPELVTLRLSRGLDGFTVGVGRATLDLTLRRGSRIVEGYLQRGDSTSEMKVALGTSETSTDMSSAGYVTATSDDAGGNRYVAGSARVFSAHANGGIIKFSTAFVDFFLGSAVGGGSAVSGDAASDLMNQYIASMTERTIGVRR